MRKYVFIAAGGAVGAVLRAAFKNIGLFQSALIIPFDTLLINVLGSFFLGLFLTYTYDRLDWHPDIRLGIATGFIGAFTTFSAMCKEIAAQLYSGRYYYAALYIFLCIFAGAASAWLGVLLGQKMADDRRRRRKLILSGTTSDIGAIGGTSASDGTGASDDTGASDNSTASDDSESAGGKHI